MCDSDLTFTFREICSVAGIDSELKIVKSEKRGAWTDGQHVFITQGLINALTPEEVGGVLGHEIAHIACRHLPAERLARENLSRAFRRRPAVGVMSMLVAEAMTSSALLALRRFRSRQDEFEADRIGQAYASRAGLGDDGLSSGLAKIASGHQQRSLWDTHPDLESRLSALGERPRRRVRIRIRRSR